MSIVFTITVQGLYDGICEITSTTFKPYYYSIKFDIVKNSDSYEIYMITHDINIKLASLYNESNAYDLLKFAMKIGMKNLLLYKNCNSCDQKIFYPHLMCSCGFCCDLEKNWNINIISKKSK